MWESPWLQASVAFLAALIVGSFLEYVVHRLMHARIFLGNKHTEHHADGWGQGWLGEFWDYFSGGLAVIWVGFLISLPIGIGWAVGCFIYACCAAYAHQLQHEHPERVFWMKRPVHYLHHAHNMWRHNFGITIDIWDRIFGTYRAEEWNPERSEKWSLRQYFQIRWIKGPSEEEIQSGKSHTAKEARNVSK